MRILLEEVWPEKAPLQKDTVLSPSKYAEWLLSGSDAIQKLASLMPDCYIDLPFPGRCRLNLNCLMDGECLDHMSI